MLAKAFTLVQLLFIAPQYAAAAQWTLIDSSQPGVRWYSSETYKLSDGTIRTYLKAEGRNLNVAPFAILLDCNKRRARNYVAGDFGTVFFQPWRVISPDSSDEIAYENYCKK
jgi:hypothetical protein